MQLRNLTNGDVIAGNVDPATSFLTRALGLLPRATVAPDEGLWIGGCSSVHTMFMRAKIDLFFLDTQGAVMKIVRDVSPYRPMVGCAGSKTVVELGSGERASTEIALGDRLSLE